MLPKSGPRFMQQIIKCLQSPESMPQGPEYLQACAEVTRKATEVPVEVLREPLSLRVPITSVSCCLAGAFHWTVMVQT